MKRLSLVLMLGGLSLGLSACPNLPPDFSASSCEDGAPSTGGSSNATLNGYTILDGGEVAFNLSVMDSDDQLVTTGSVCGPGVSNAVATGGESDDGGSSSSGSGSGGGSSSGSGAVTWTASVCEDITFRGALTSVITLDATGSMADNDHYHLRLNAAKDYVSRMEDDLAAVTSFETCTRQDPYRAIQLWQPFTADQDLLDTAIHNAVYEGCGTDLWDAISDSAHLLNPIEDHNKAALILTDGEDNSSQKTRDEAVLDAQIAGARVYIVGLAGQGGGCAEVNCTDLQYVAAQTNGTFALADDADQLDTLFTNMLYAARASGCLSVKFSVDGRVPTPCTTISGWLDFEVNGRPYSVQFSVTF